MIIEMTYPVVSDRAIMTGDYLPLTCLLVIVGCILIGIFIYLLHRDFQVFKILWTRRMLWRKARRSPWPNA